MWLLVKAVSMLGILSCLETYTDESSLFLVAPGLFKQALGTSSINLMHPNSRTVFP